jgi:hypothetical protein
MFVYCPIERTPIQQLSAGNEWLKPGARRSVTKGRTDQKRRGFRPTELCSRPGGTGFSAP